MFLGRLASRPNPPASGRRIYRAFLGRLASGPNPPTFGRRIGRAFLGLFPLELLGWAGWLGVLGLGPRYPQCPPFSCRGGRPSLVGKKNKVDRHIIGNNLPLMLLNFQCNFCNFFVTALDAIGSSVSILRYRSHYKRRG